jgi:hypothetical protein
MGEGPPAELAAGRLDAPAGEGARRLLDVLLAVIAFAEGEQLHHLAREVLVRAAAPAGRRIEVDHHRRILAHGMQQLVEATQRVAPQQPVLVQHQLGALHLLHAGDEMVVPEQGHALAQLLGRVDCAANRVSTHQRRRRCRSCVAARGAARRKVLESGRGWHVPGEFGRNRGACLGRCRQQQSLDRRPAREAGELGQVRRAGAEAGALQQVAGVLDTHGRRERGTRGKDRQAGEDVAEDIHPGLRNRMPRIVEAKCKRKVHARAACVSPCFRRRRGGNSPGPQGPPQALSAGVVGG